MRNNILLIALSFVYSVSFSQDIGTRIFQEPALNNLIRQPISNLPNDLYLTKTISDSIKRDLLPFAVYEELVFPKDYKAFGRFKVEKCYLCINKKELISACLFKISSKIVGLVDSVMNELGTPTAKFSVNTDEIFDLNQRKENIFWKFPNCAIFLMRNFFKDSDLLVINNDNVYDYMKSGTE